jgi:diguanylate cyclase (GGDEF)-like protein
MSGDKHIEGRPPRLAYLLVPLLHYLSVRLTFACAVTPENEVVVWLPNAVLLAALLRYRGQRGWLFAALTFASDTLGNLPQFAWPEALLLSLVNLIEVLSTFYMMGRFSASPRFERVQDLTKFVVAGPMLSAFLASFLAATVIEAIEHSTTPYLALMRVWWFGDGLGLLIYTPLLLAFAHPSDDEVRFRWPDGLVVLLSLGLAGAIFSGREGGFGDLFLTPTLLLPSILFMAARLGRRWTALAVALVSLATAYTLTLGHSTPGSAAAYSRVVQAQEFIMTLCIVGLGFAALLSELKRNERELEAKVRERTRSLEAFNDRLAALSATDGLTGIANRRRFDEWLDKEWGRARRAQEPLALALIDVDWFKSYNDRYGHQLGDDCLRTVARILESHIGRSGDLAARYGGEEFALIAPTTHDAGALRIATTVCQAIERAGIPHESSEFGVVTVSIGVAVLVPDETTTLDLLVTRADAALYQAKAAGRNRVVLAAGPIAPPAAAAPPAESGSP